MRHPVWVSCLLWLNIWLQTSHSCCLVAVAGQKDWSCAGWTPGPDYTYKTPMDGPGIKLRVASTERVQISPVPPGQEICGKVAIDL